MEWMFSSSAVEAAYLFSNAMYRKFFVSALFYSDNEDVSGSPQRIGKSFFYITH